MATTMEEPPVYTLTSADRCEYPDCGARAYIRAYVGDTHADLSFCGHHGRLVEAKLRPIAFVWIDETSAIVSQRSGG